MKRSPLKRTGWLARGTKPMKRGGKLKAVNAERLAKRREKLKRWHSSSAWRKQRKESLARAGHQCEYVFSLADATWLNAGKRCLETTQLHVHERRYAFERSSLADRQVLCAYHHAFIERRDHPTRRRGQ